MLVHYYALIRRTLLLNELLFFFSCFAECIGSKLQFKTMTSSLYDDLDILDGTPLDNLTSSESSNKSGNAPLVGLRVTANWSESDVTSSNQFNVNASSVNSNSR